MWSFLQGAALSYRGLFTWLNPWGYLSSRIVRPIGVALTFTAASAHYGAAVGPTLVGAGLLAGAHAVIYGMALSVGNERNYGTMQSWLASPQNILGAMCQRALPHLLDGFISGALTFLVCGQLFHQWYLSIGMFAALLALTLLSSAGLGLVVGGLNLRVRDMFLWPNIVVLLLMLFSGVLMASERLPAVLRPVAAAFPLSHVMAAVRSGAVRFGDAALAYEVGVGLCWFALGVLTVQLMLRDRGER